MSDEIETALVQPTRMQDKPGKFDRIKKLEADKAELEEQLEAAEMMRNNSVKCSQPVATNWPAG